MLLLRCLECRKLFPENQEGEDDRGQPRAMCPRCAEEIDIEEVGEIDPDEAATEDSTGFPY